MGECMQCGRCCYNHTVLLTFRDLREIHDADPALDLRTIFWILEPTRTCEHQNSLDPLFAQILFDDSTRSDSICGYLALRFVSQADPQVRQCVFFQPAGKTCAIHAHKPLMCRAYPHIINDKGGVEWDHGRCPQPWEYVGDDITRKKALLQAAIESYRQFATEAAAWNAVYEKKSLVDFLAFVLTCSENKIPT